MAKPSLEQEVLNRLRQLPRRQQRMVLDFARFLVLQQINDGYDLYSEEAFDELLAASRQDVERAGFSEADVPHVIEQVRAERTKKQAQREQSKK